MKRPAHFRLTTAAVALSSILVGCASIGSKTIPRDRFDYSGALADSWKRQTLLNIVKLRYLDLPTFLDVGQIVSGYSLETAMNVGGTLSSPTAIQGDNASIGASARYTDRPTITYVPLTGNRFLRNLLDPFPPAGLFRLVQAGYAPDNLFELTVDSFNGLRNRGMRGNRAADPEFFRALALLRELHETTGIGMRIQPVANGPETAVVFFRPPAGAETAKQAAEELKALLHLESEHHRYELVDSPYQERPDHLAVRTRSLLQVLFALSTYVDVPPAHLAQGSSLPVPPVETDRAPLLHVYSGTAAPDTAFFAVPYRDHWYWIDDTDQRSKLTFVSVMFLFTLTGNDETAQRPVLTIPTS